MTSFILILLALAVNEDPKPASPVFLLHRGFQLGTSINTPLPSETSQIDNALKSLQQYFDASYNSIPVEGYETILTLISIMYPNKSFNPFLEYLTLKSLFSQSCSGMIGYLTHFALNTQTPLTEELLSKGSHILMANKVIDSHSLVSVLNIYSLLFQNSSFLDYSGFEASLEQFDYLWLGEILAQTLVKAGTTAHEVELGMQSGKNVLQCVFALVNSPIKTLAVNTPADLIVALAANEPYVADILESIRSYQTKGMEVILKKAEEFGAKLINIFY